MNKYTYPYKVNPVVGFFVGCLAGVMMFGCGVVLTIFLPCIGWVFGPAMILISFGMPFSFIGRWEGPCPVCGNLVSLGTAGTCGVCKKRVIRSKFIGDVVFVVYD